MINPFRKKRKSPAVIIHHGSSNLLSGNIGSLPSSLSPIMISGVCSSGNFGIGTASSNANWGFATASTFTFQSPEELMEIRKKQLSDEFEKNPELFSEIIVELRKRKIKKIKENI